MQPLCHVKKWRVLLQRKKRALSLLILNVARNAKYIILTDPLDGSSNIDVNVSVGTIFSIYRRVSPIGSPVTLEDFMQPGNKQVAAGYIVYGSSTMLVYILVMV